MIGKNTQKCLTTSKKGLDLHKRKPSVKVKNNNWWTPIWLYIQLCLIYKIKPRLDVAADKFNHKCDKYFTKEDDALTRDWLYEHDDGTVEIVDVWCNPPNGGRLLGDFIRKAYEQHTKWGMRIMMIIPTNTMSSNAFWDCIENPKDNGELIFYKPIWKRIEFLDEGKQPEFGARNAYLVVIFG